MSNISNEVQKAIDSGDLGEIEGVIKASNFPFSFAEILQIIMFILELLKSKKL